MNVQSNDREAAPEITDATLRAAVRSSHCHQLLEFGRVLPTACSSTTPLLWSRRQKGQLQRFPLYIRAYRIGVWSVRLMTGTDGVRSLESVGVARTWRRGSRL